MKILLTGATGFIGCSLINALSDNYEVIGFSRTKQKTKKYSSIFCDLKKQIPVVKDVDACIHLAALTDQETWHSNYLKVFQVNVIGTYKLLEMLKSNSKIKKFVYTSTGGIYGFSSSPLTEEKEAKPFDLNSLTKYLGEIICQYYINYFPVTVLRYFFPYGPGNSPTRLIPLLIHKIKNNKSIELNVSQKPIINPVYIQDLVDVTIKALKKPGKFSVFNIAGNEKVNIRELAEIIGQLIGKKPRFICTKKKSQDIVADISKAKRLLGFKPMTNLREGLMKEIDYWFDR
ncbi:MAG: NAD-dependent epimerase/dehydratase family protein [Promethearchaeota archaeon]